MKNISFFHNKIILRAIKRLDKCVFISTDYFDN